MKNTNNALVLMLSACLCCWQSQPIEETRGAMKGDTKVARSETHPVPEQVQRGRQILELAEAQVPALPAGMRAYALLQLARTYQNTDSKKAKQYLEEGLVATRGMDEDALHTKRELQERILQALVGIAPQSADELLEQAMPEVRGAVLRNLMQYYKDQKDLDRAIQVLYRAGGEDEIPYDAAAEILAALPPQRSADVLNIFNASLVSYTNHVHAEMMESDFAGLILRFWRKLPKDTVLEAIAEVLKQAKSQGENHSDTNISMGSSKGAVTFNSFYDYRLFQLLPVLRELDESAAKKLVEEHQQVQTLLAKYPQGMGSLNAGDDPNNPQVGFMTIGSSGGSPVADERRRSMPTAFEMQQMSKIVADAEAHPQDALANAALLPRANMRAYAYEAIAHSTAKKNPGVAREALAKLLTVEVKEHGQKAAVGMELLLAAFLLSTRVNTVFCVTNTFGPVWYAAAPSFTVIACEAICMLMYGLGPPSAGVRLAKCMRAEKRCSILNPVPTTHQKIA